MNFLNPVGLLGFVALPIIVGLHLYLHRDQHVEVSSLFLWAFLEGKSYGRRPRNPRFTWLLFLDLSVAAVLSLAFAQPQVDLPAVFGQSTQVIIILDTSTSMLAIDVQPSRFAAAKSDLIELLEALENQTNVSVIAVGNDVEFVGNTLDLSRQSLNRRVAALAAGCTGFELHSGLGLAEALLENTRSAEIHIFTDGAYEVEENVGADLPIVWHFYGEPWPNEAVTDINLSEISEGVNQLFSILRNYSEFESVHQLKVFADGAEIHQAEVILPPESSSPYVITFHGDFQYFRVEIDGTDPLQEDDIAEIAFRSEQWVRAALVAENPEPLERALLANSSLELTVIDPKDYWDSASYDLVVFRNYLPEKFPSGEVVIFDPPPDATVLEVRGVKLIENPLSISQDPITAGLDFSGVRWQESRSLPDWQSQFTPLVTSGDIPLLLKTEIPGGNLIVFLPELSVGNLTKHPSFPMLISNMVENARDSQIEQDYLIGERIDFLKVQEGSYSLVSPAGISTALDRGLEIRLSQLGRHTLVMENNSTSQENIYFGVNAGEMDESDIRPREWSTDVTVLESSFAEDQTINAEIAPWLVGLAIILLIVEAWRAWR